MNPIPINKFEALLFDLDGTLVDSMALHNQAWLSTMNDLGHPISLEILFEYTGVPNDKTVEIFNGRFGWNLNPQAVAAEKEKRFSENLFQVRPVDAILKIAQHFQNKKAMAVVTGSSRDLAERLLLALDLRKYFAYVVSADDTILHKPNPEPFLKAAQLLNVSPENCLVFEDGQAGIQAAKAAGMQYVQVVLPDQLYFEGQRSKSEFHKPKIST